MSLRHLWLLPLVLLLGACATHENMRDTAQLPPGTGVMVAKVLVRSVKNIPYPPVSISIGAAGSMFDSKIIALDQRDNTVVLQLPAGEYSWTNVSMLDLSGDTRHNMPFTIEAGKINYVGDLLLLLDSMHLMIMHGREFPSYVIYIKDLHRYTLAEASPLYPTLWKTYPVVTHLTQDERRTAK